MEPKVTVPKEGDYNITYLTGKALDPIPPNKIRIAGDINTVKYFLEKRYHESEGFSMQEVNTDRAVVYVSYEKGEIWLHLDPEDKLGAEVMGSLTEAEELTRWNINTVKQYTREELVKLIRMNRRFFQPGVQGPLLEAFQKLQLSGITELAETSDNRGNKKLNFEKKIQSAVPTEFVLTVPLFRGGVPESFRVEIGIEATDASVRFWLESVELEELLEVRRKSIIDLVLQSCKEFVIVYV